MVSNERKVVLQFTDLKTLLDFSQLIDLNNCEIVRSKFVLFCSLSKEQIETAQTKYHAQIID